MEFVFVYLLHQRRVATYFLHEQMLANYRALYDVTARAFDLPREGE